MVTYKNPDLVFVHGPDFDGLGFDGVRVRVRVWIRVFVGINSPGFDGPGFDGTGFDK